MPVPVRFSWVAIPTGFSLVAEIELLRDEFAVPVKDRVRRDNCGEFTQSLAAEGMAFDAQ